MRIAMIHWGYPPVIGGVESHLVQLCPALVRAGHDVSLLTGSHPEEPRREYLEGGVRVRRLPIMDLNWLFKRGIVSLEAEITREIKNFLDVAKPDVVHAHNMHYFSRTHERALGAVAHARRIPIVLTAHNMWDDTDCLELIRSPAWRHIIAVSDYIKKEILGCGVEAHRVTVIHHGIDGARFRAANRAEALARYPQLAGRTVIFNPARMGLAKGCAVLVKAFTIVKQQVPGAFLVMAGTKNIIDWGLSQEREIAYIIKLRDTFGLADDMLIDFFSYDAMPMMYAAADVCAYPSIYAEPFGLAMLESMAAGKPIVVTRSGGMPEVIEHRRTGLIVESRDHIALAKALLRLLKDPAFRRRLGREGTNRYREKYQLARMSKDVLSVYDKAMAAGA